MTAPNRCPNCGELVSMFAAGCAICGTPLDPARRRRSLAERLRATLARRRQSGPAERPPG
jgi:hypothetical protein